jgi:hypothetical protein
VPRLAKGAWRSARGLVDDAAAGRERSSIRRAALRRLVLGRSPCVAVKDSLRPEKADLLPEALYLPTAEAQRMGAFRYGKLTALDPFHHVELPPLPMAHPHPSSIEGVTESLAC